MRTWRIARPAAVAALWMALWIGSSWAADAVFRCGNNTVVRGDTTVRVLAVCGKPDFREDLGEREEAVVEPGPGYTILYKKEKRRVEKWHYNRGYGDYIYALTFGNGVLESVESAGRGY